MDIEKLRQAVVKVQAGDNDAATDLYLLSRDDLYYYIMKTVNDPHLAEDLLQDSFMEILQTIHNLKEPGAFVTWSRQIAYHRCTAYFRKHHELLADENEDGQTIFDTVEEDREEFIPDAALEKEDLKATIGQMIDSLPPDQRSALVLRYFEELSVADIARIQGVSEGTVKSRLNYGRKAIKASVENYEKKNGIKLHSVAILPLILWFFRQKTIDAGGSLTAKGAAKGAAVAAKGTTAAAKGTAAAKTGANVAVKTVAKTAAKGIAGRVITGIVAGTLVAGIGTAVVVQNLKPTEEEPEETTETRFQIQNPDDDPAIESKPGPSDPTGGNDPSTPTQPTTGDIDIGFEDLPGIPGLPAANSVWAGDGTVGETPCRFTLTVTKISKTELTGKLTVSGQGISHETGITGDCEALEGELIYSVVFDNPHYFQDGITGSTMMMSDIIYSAARGQFYIDGTYQVELEKIS